VEKGRRSEKDTLHSYEKREGKGHSGCSSGEEKGSAAAFSGTRQGEELFATESGEGKEAALCTQSAVASA